MRIQNCPMHKHACRWREARLHEHMHKITQIPTGSLNNNFDAC